MNYTYLIVDLLVFLSPILFGLIFKFKDISITLKRFFLTFLIAAPFFIIWDSIFSQNGYWGFNPNYIIGTKLIGLPLEEIFFFFCIPFASIAIYELINHFKADESIKINKYLLLSVSIMLAVLSIPANKPYTSIVMALVLVLLIVSHYFKIQTFYTKNFWLFILVSFIPFFIVNSFLTSLPIVLYNPAAILGFRIISIPIEDFFYSFFMLTVYMFVYNAVKKKLK